MFLTYYNGTETVLFPAAYALTLPVFLVHPGPGQSSGRRSLWEDLYAAHADLVLAGHEHSYERFAPQDPQGSREPVHGIREIVVGTGGRSHSPLGVPTPNSEVRNWTTYGVLRLTLSRGKYHWEFIPVEGQRFHDSGDGVCHKPPASID